MRGASLARHLLVAAGLAGLCAVAQSCDQSVPAPPPPAGSGSTDSGKKKLKGDDDDDDDKKSSDKEDDSGEAFGSSSGEETGTSGSDSSGGGETSSSASSDEPTEPASFKRDGAQSVGDDAQKKEVKDCGGKGKLYDRFADAATCTGVDLAKIDCTEDGIKAALAALKDDGHLSGQFKEAIGTTYSGMEVDQCIDCPKGTSIAQCQTSKPPTNGGTKVLFVKVDGAKVNGKGMMLPIRPFQK